MLSVNPKLINKSVDNKEVGFKWVCQIYLFLDEVLSKSVVIAMVSSSFEYM